MKQARYRRSQGSGDASPMLWAVMVLLLAAGYTDAAEPATVAERKQQQNAAVEVLLAQDGQALQSIIIAGESSARVKTATRELADYLQRISGATFNITTGDGHSGIVLGTCDDFPDLVGGLDLDPSDPFRRDEYLLQSHATGIRLIGASDWAVEHTVWDLLSCLGYRLFFLTDTWEIIPEVEDLRVAVNSLEKPDYVTRMAPRGAPGSSVELWNRWKKRNRVFSAFRLGTGHSYERIIRQHQAVFKEHPEYLALVKGKRGGNKFCISNPGLRKLVVDYAVNTMKKYPDWESVSLDPSDGGGWCTCEACVKMGSVTDRVVTLANLAAAAINALGLGPKYIGIYGYSRHSIPPTVHVHPRVIVSLATGFIRGGHTIDTMIEGWGDRGATLGIREYHDVFSWSHDLPRKARGGNVPYLQRTIPHFHRESARFMNSENRDAWGANGLGYWMTPALLWDVTKADHVEALFDDFLDKAFGPAREPMQEFYTFINFHQPASRTTEDTVARMYRSLSAALELTKEPAIRKRLEDLILYTRYIELYHAYKQSSPKVSDKSADLSPRQKAYNDICVHVLRMKDRYMLSTKAIVYRDRYRDKSIVYYADSTATGQSASKADPTQSPFSRQEVLSILKTGIAANQPVILDFEPVDFSHDLVAVRAPTITPTKEGVYALSDKGSSLVGRGSRTFSVWLDEPAAIEIGVTGGLIPHYRDRGNVKITLHSSLEEMGDPVASDKSVPPDGKERRILLRSRFQGLHTLEVSDGNDKTAIRLPAGIPITVASGINDSPGGWPGRRASATFYVPRGTTILGGFCRETSGQIMDGNGKAVFTFSDMKKPGFFSLPIPTGQDGTYWQFKDCSDTRHLMTVPPYLAKQPELLLLPREVAEKDFAGK